MASAKIITYDLCNSGKNYDELYKYIKSLSSWTHVNESVWVAYSEKTCPKIRNELKGILDSDDRIFVAKLSGEAAWIKSLCKNDSLKSILNS